MLPVGARIGAYEILSSLGRGGMGEVYRARHLRLERDVAIKMLPQEVASDRDRLERFEREARLASSLNHRNIITIYDVAEEGGRAFLAMELVDGQTLRQVMRAGTIPTDTAIEIASQIADGLAAAHAAGIVHRDLKPENIMLTAEGVVKILDFGLARSVPQQETAPETSTLVRTSPEGFVPGTPRYMSPEQIGRGAVDQRSDQFAFGIVLYEMLAGRPPFDSPSLGSLITAISHDPPPPLEPLRKDLPSDLARLVRKCLAKSPEDRYPSTRDVCRALLRIRARRARRPLMRALAAGAGTVVLLSALGFWMWSRGAERRWAEKEAPAQITARIDAGNVFAAYRLAMRARRAIGAQPEIDGLLGRISLPRKFVTDPPGAEVSMKGYDTPEAAWEPLGVTPFETRIPYALMRLRIRKDGYETYEGAPMGAGILATFNRGMKLEPAGSSPAGMVRIFPNNFTGGAQSIHLPGGAGAVSIGGFWLDRTEVTNKAFKAFVDAGGYGERKYWVDGFPLSEGNPRWQSAVSSFKDTTGRPAPATWSLASYPEGADDLPVGGVSWYEAAAYCRYAGKVLPTIYHWSSAIGQEQFSDILRMSNFDGKGPAPVGSYQGLAGFGSLDMAGNVKEWCWNGTPAGQRHLLGGAWNEPGYVFQHDEARDPLERLPTEGFRCARYGSPPDPILLGEADPTKKVTLPPPVSDEVFDAYRGMYAYERTPLNARTEKVDDSSPYWRKEVVSFDAAYGKNERVLAILFLPRNVRLPYQTVIWFAGADAFAFRSSDTLAGSYLFDFVPRSGRALVYLIFDGIYERWHPRANGPVENRDEVIRWAKDFGRTVDYLQTRRDIDASRLAYYGLSLGANLGPIMTAVDGRMKASILLGGGLVMNRQRPESVPAHFAPRCRVPTLLISGTDDFIIPYDAQKALMNHLGTPPGQKRHARLEGGHIPSDRLAIIREVLDWLDKYLGPVQTDVTKRGDLKAP